jgi:iron(III) transport system ATP-binding protein
LNSQPDDLADHRPDRHPHHQGLQVRGVVKRFGDTSVLEGADLTVPVGSTVAVLGPSGGGKTTLLRILAGFETPDAGTVTVGDRLLAGPGVSVAPDKRRVGMVFQDWALFPHLTVAQNVGFGLPRGMRRGAVVADTLDMVGLSGLGDRMPHTLSGGQQQRVAIARTIAPRPEVMLLDEPFSNLDAGLRIRVRSDVHTLLRDLGITTVFVTHDQEEAFVLGDQVAVMKDGVIVQQDTPSGLYDRPRSEWIAGFVGEANLVPAHAEGNVATTPFGLVPLAEDAGGSCRVLVRPESLVLSAGGEGAVGDVEFYGHDTAYRVDLPWGRVLVRAMAAPRFHPGDPVGVAYAGPRAVSFPADGPAVTELIERPAAVPA